MRKVGFLGVMLTALALAAAPARADDKKAPAKKETVVDKAVKAAKAAKDVIVDSSTKTSPTGGTR